MYKFNKIETLLWYKAVGTFHRSHSWQHWKLSTEIYQWLYTY